MRRHLYYQHLQVLLGRSGRCDGDATRIALDDTDVPVPEVLRYELVFEASGCALKTIGPFGPGDYEDAVFSLPAGGAVQRITPRYW